MTALTHTQRAGLRPVFPRRPGHVWHKRGVVERLKTASRHLYTSWDRDWWGGWVGPDPAMLADIGMGPPGFLWSWCPWLLAQFWWWWLWQRLCPVCRPWLGHPRLSRQCWDRMARRRRRPRWNRRPAFWCQCVGQRTEMEPKKGLKKWCTLNFNYHHNFIFTK